eukprot:654336-Rhodomonas_salina.2
MQQRCSPSRHSTTTISAAAVSAYETQTCCQIRHRHADHMHGASWAAMRVRVLKSAYCPVGMIAAELPAATAS